MKFALKLGFHQIFVILRQIIKYFKDFLIKFWFLGLNIYITYYTNIVSKFCWFYYHNSFIQLIQFIAILTFLTETLDSVAKRKGFAINLCLINSWSLNDIIWGSLFCVEKNFIEWSRHQKHLINTTYWSKSRLQHSFINSL